MHSFSLKRSLCFFQSGYMCIDIVVRFDIPAWIPKKCKGKRKGLEASYASLLTKCEKMQAERN